MPGDCDAPSAPCNSVVEHLFALAAGLSLALLVVKRAIPVLRSTLILQPGGQVIQNVTLASVVLHPSAQPRGNHTEVVLLHHVLGASTCPQMTESGGQISQK